MKRRTLEPGQQVILIYDHQVGFVRQEATFTEYRTIFIGEVSHQIPVFDYKGKEVTGMECFWLLPENAKSARQIERIQSQLVGLQVQALEMARELDYTMPEKIKDPKIKKMAEQNVERMQSVIDKFGFDPRDESWVESMAVTDRERNWFQFERENGLVFTENWDDIIVVFNKEFKDEISAEQAKNMSKKRMRYWMGAYGLRMSGNADQAEWVKVARDFEQMHRARENRMLTWTLAHKGKFPVVKTKEPVQFWPGPYFHQFLEKVPQFFETPQLKLIKKGVILRVISYDPTDKYIRLDFSEDVRRKIKEEDKEDPWIKDRADYDIWLKPEEIETHLELIDSLE